VERGHGFWRGVLFHGDKSDITGFFDVFWVRARAVVARVAPGGKSFVSPGRCHASKCLLRNHSRQTLDVVAVHHSRRSMAGIRKTGLLAANALFATAWGARKYFCEFLMMSVLPPKSDAGTNLPANPPIRG